MTTCSDCTCFEENKKHKIGHIIWDNTCKKLNIGRNHDSESCDHIDIIKTIIVAPLKNPYTNNGDIESNRFE